MTGTGDTLLVSCLNQLAVWDGGQRTVHDSFSNYWGVTWSEDALFILGRRGEQRQRVWRLGRGFREASALPYRGFRDAHQMLWADGALHVANTGKNRVEVCRGKRQRPVNWTGQEADVDHINSIWFGGGRFYVVEHRLALQPKRVRVFDRGWEMVGAFEVELPSRGLHNAYVEGGRLVSLAFSEVVAWDVATGRHEMVPVLDGAGLPPRVEYLRGFAATADHYYVGVSEVAERDGRTRGRSAVLRTDHDFRVLDALLLEGAGQVHDVRVISQPDLAHNGLPFPGGVLP